MKKFFIVLVLCGFFHSCSPDDNNNDDLLSDISLNPPTWLQGTWEEEVASIHQSEIEVSENNIKILSFGGASIFDIVGHAKNSASAPNSSANITETLISKDAYSFVMTVNYQNAEVLRMTFKFILIDPGIIEYSQNSSTFRMKKVSPQ